MLSAIQLRSTPTAFLRVIAGALGFAGLASIAFIICQAFSPFSIGKIALIILVLPGAALFLYIAFHSGNRIAIPNLGIPRNTTGTTGAVGFALRGFRVVFGLILFVATCFFAALFFAFSIEPPKFWNQCVLGLIAIFFVLMACAIWRILIVRRMSQPQNPPQFSPPPSGPSGPVGEALVPTSPKNTPPTLSAAAEIQPEEWDALEEAATKAQGRPDFND